MGDEKIDRTKLDQVEHDIEEARQAAIDAGVVDDPDKQRFYESGELSDVDDQAIAP